MPSQRHKNAEFNRAKEWPDSYVDKWFPDGPVRRKPLILEGITPFDVGDLVRLRTGCQVFRVTHVEWWEPRQQWMIRGRFGVVQFFQYEDAVEHA